MLAEPVSIHKALAMKEPNQPGPCLKGLKHGVSAKVNSGPPLAPVPVTSLDRTPRLL